MPPVDHIRAPAKLTRSLRLVGLRADGYHLLEAEMVTLDLSDELEIEQDEDGLEVVDEVDWTGEPAPVPAGAQPGSQARDACGPDNLGGTDNLVARALSVAGRRARVRLIKRVPAGAGLGGGSADAAAVLRWAGVLDAGVSVGLGADVPFCVVGGRALVRGIGEQVETIPFEAFTAVLVTPALRVSTPEVYRAWDALGCPEGDHGNDLEPAALAVEPRLTRWRDLVSSVAGERPRLAGSGGTWYLERGAESARALAAELKSAVVADGGRAVVAAAASIPGT
jgi:4-diphosphocytidyl-2-C-methyl-D-erythritol kinase